MFTQLSGCGFHLRGFDSKGLLTFNSAQLQIEPGVRADIERAVTQQLTRSGVILLKDLTAEVQIQLLPTQYKATRTSSSGLGDATSELVKMTQGFKVTDLTSGAVILSDTSTVYRDRQINTDTALASESELRTIQKSMSAELARQVLDRIRRAMPLENKANK